MIMSGNFEAARPHRQAVTILTGDVFGRTNIIAGGGMADGPHAYLVEQLPEVVLPPHFHMNDQFQVVVAGSGMLGRSHKLAPLTVHFARGKTAYGPIVAGLKGLSYLTLRQHLEYGAHYLSDPNIRVDRAAAKFHTTSDPVAAPDADELRAATTSSQKVLIPPNADGLAVWSSRLPPSAALAVPLHDPQAGRFHVVVGGTAIMGSETFPLWSCIWVSAGEQPVSIKAGLGGAELLTLQFPRYNTINSQQRDQSAGADIPS